MEHTIQLKGTDLKVSPIAFGTVRAGLDWDGAAADEMLNHYVDHGGNLIDSARVYYDWVEPEVGRSERVLGEWLRRSKRRNEIVLITKGGHPERHQMHISRMGQADMEYDLNLSLKTLGVDTIDIYFYHRDDPERSVGELLERMEGFCKQGKIRYYGCSNWTTARMVQAEEYAKAHGIRGFVANQNLYNIASDGMKPFDDDTMVTADDAMLDFYRHSANTPMPYFSICSAFFHILAAKGEDAVRSSCYFTPKNVALAQKIDELRQKYHCTITQVLMGFYFTRDFTVIPLAGTADIPQLDDLLGSTDIRFDPKDFALQAEDDAPLAKAYLNNVTKQLSATRR